VIINDRSFLDKKGPLLIASNHPNSFLDAIIITTLFNQPVHSLARGDVFSNKFYTWLLNLLHILPVYRVSEGVENIENNYTTFSACQDIFNRNGIVLIFSEGGSENEWHLRPLKKGTARLAITAWNENVPLEVLPLGVNYSSFRVFGKNVILNFGKMITSIRLPEDTTDGKKIIAFNAKLEDELKRLVIEANEKDKQFIRNKFFVPQPVIKKFLLIVPAITGWLCHIPLYLPIKLLIQKKADVHFDSIVVGLLFILYPVYVITITIILYISTHSIYAWLTLILLPFTAWSYVQLKNQFENRRS